MKIILSVAIAFLSLVVVGITSCVVALRSYKKMKKVSDMQTDFPFDKNNKPVVPIMIKGSDLKTLKLEYIHIFFFGYVNVDENQITIGSINGATTSFMFDSVEMLKSSIEVFNETNNFEVVLKLKEVE